MKKSLKSMLIFSKTPSTMKATERKEAMTQKNLIILIRTTRMSSGRVVPPTRPFTTLYQNLFLGYYFSCNNFGHKALDC
jgi:hypothetical protein